ncbi:MAG: hypothetical protein A2042_07550 [Candidatus Schekmanbacteria bacterium GWA2_38_11]|uniref:Epoxyqueuosine reductase QueH n=1 Tax=Candidatus Schekmanbacteria bacterium GWA2_38_11 TaxID=1817876 RepID=A0A1F7RE32_9BACT|nr:MAG: hypothetical protein A2042_07550 [Candidatus Schekmanbacteria bacterium GWA2_38_11]
MKLLLHTCCAPCSIYPKKILEESFDVTGFFYNLNIHPFQEYLKRKDTVKEFSDKSGFNVLYKDEYDIEKFFKTVPAQKEDRCSICYSMRLNETAKEAMRLNFDSFSTTLLYSIYMNHELVRGIGNKISSDTGVEFYYRDFRIGWQEGVKISKEMGLYRQKYCGCLYSEWERYRKRKAKNWTNYKL